VQNNEGLTTYISNGKRHRHHVTPDNYDTHHIIVRTTFFVPSITFTTPSKTS
jgi:hypothetical protein